MPDLKKYKHMTFDDRLAIQEGLTQGLTFKAISENIGKDKCTVSKEIRKHITGTALPLRRHNQNGDALEQTICPKLMKAPYVCNGCTKRRVRCAYPKRLYIAKTAQAESEILLAEAREGIPLNKDDFYEVDRIVSRGINQGQHLYHITQTHNLGVSQSTVYRHLNRGYLSVSRKRHCRPVGNRGNSHPTGSPIAQAVAKLTQYSPSENENPSHARIFAF